MTDLGFCQDGAAVIAAAVAEALMPETTVESVLHAVTAYLAPWSGYKMLTPVTAAQELRLKPATTRTSGSQISPATQPKANSLSF